MFEKKKKKKKKKTLLAEATYQFISKTNTTNNSTLNIACEQHFYSFI